ncbi:MAG: pseudouridine synthase [Rhodanobacteraceae bacterium]
MPPSPSPARPRHGLARALSKLGICSRTQAADAIRAGRVALNGRIVRDPEHPTDSVRDRIVLDGRDVRASERIYLMLNKPRGYVTTASDERGRKTVYDLLGDGDLPWIAPVGRLDKASEGLLLLTNDSEWAARITSPATKVDKIYHVHIDKTPNSTLIDALVRGIDDGDAILSAKSARELRRGEKNAWLEIVLDEGRNRQIRRLLEAHGIGVLRLVRVAIGPLALGALEKGRHRPLDALEVAAFAR